MAEVELAHRPEVQEKLRRRIDSCAVKVRRGAVICGTGGRGWAAVPAAVVLCLAAWAVPRGNSPSHLPTIAGLSRLFLARLFDSMCTKMLLGRVR